MKKIMQTVRFVTPCLLLLFAVDICAMKRGGGKRTRKSPTSAKDIRKKIESGIASNTKSIAQVGSQLHGLRESLPATYVAQEQYEKDKDAAATALGNTVSGIQSKISHFQQLISQAREKSATEGVNRRKRYDELGATVSSNADAIVLLTEKADESDKNMNSLLSGCQSMQRNQVRLSDSLAVLVQGVAENKRNTQDVQDNKMRIDNLEGAMFDSLLDVVLQNEQVCEAFGKKLLAVALRDKKTKKDLASLDAHVISLLSRVSDLEDAGYVSEKVYSQEMAMLAGRIIQFKHPVKNQGSKAGRIALLFEKQKAIEERVTKENVTMVKSIMADQKRLDETKKTLAEFKESLESSLEKVSKKVDVVNARLQSVEAKVEVLATDVSNLNGGKKRTLVASQTEG